MCATATITQSASLTSSILVSVIFIIMGNLIPKCRQTYTLGIRLPWTLASEENWNKTHRFAGKVWFIGGILSLILSFLGQLSIILWILLPLGLLPTVYSFIHYVKYDKQAE